MTHFTYAFSYDFLENWSFFKVQSTTIYSYFFHATDLECDIKDH